MDGVADLRGHFRPLKALLFFFLFVCLFVFFDTERLSDGSKGGDGRAPGPKFLYFHAFFGKNWSK